MSKMPSTDHFVKVDDARDVDAAALRCWGNLTRRYELQAILIARYDIEHNLVNVEWSYNIPTAPLRGSEKGHLEAALNECFLIHPKPHIHAMKEGGLASIICRLNRQLKEQFRMWFFPFKCGDAHFVFLGFPEPEMAKMLPAELKDSISAAMSMLDGSQRAAEMENRMKVTEQFLKEVGHDVASAAQACVAKLRNVAEGMFSGETAKIKAREVEMEIWGIYRIAESLGIVADPEYRLRMPDDFDLNEVVRTVVKLFDSEAAERHIRIQIMEQKSVLMIWGEGSAIQQAICQLISNAIKYSFGGTDIIISTAERESDILIRVSNKGHPLPDGEELRKIWDFGYRGEKATELHVNGSGIGLFTVKKIVAAHRGWKDAKSASGNTDFYIHLPKKAALKRDLGILL